jgi:5-methylcytosine-specific restriction endonuclease McrA
MVPMELDAREQQQLAMYGLDTIRDVARRLAAGITGKGKTDWATHELIHALAYGCPYCGGRIMLDNGVIDHKKAIGSAIRNAPADSPMRRMFDNPDNVHIICTPCNQLKGDFDHEDYVALRAFLDEHESLERKLRRRLSQTGTFFKLRKADQAARGKKPPIHRRGGGFKGF